METKDFLLLNMMKQQLLVIYQTFEEKPELLDDHVVSEAYEALQTVTDNAEMRQWSKLMKILGLSYTENFPVEREDNVLGELDDLTSRADWEVLNDFISFKCTFSPAEWSEKQEENCRLVRSIQQMAERCYDVHIIIIECGGQWVAVGNDADRLFEIYGWQTSVVFNGEEDIPFMFISDSGFTVLLESDYSVKRLHLEDEENEDEIFLSSCFNEDMVCAMQQDIDYARLVMRQQDDLQKFIEAKASFVRPKSGFGYVVNGSYTIYEDKVIAKGDDGEEVVLADGQSWRLDEIGLPYLINFRPLGKA